MTFDSRDILSPTHTHIKLANGDCVRVDGEGPLALFSSLQLKISLFTPDLTYKLLSISQLTRELNCIVLVNAHGCVMQDA